MADRNRGSRGVAFTDRLAAAEEETRALMHDSELAGEDGRFPVPWQQSELIASFNSDLPVYCTIHKIRADITEAIDDPYSLEQLKDFRMNVSVLRPLVDKYYKLQDISIIYCLLVNRTQFLRERTTAPHYQSVNITRALLCELVANRILRRFSEDYPGPDGLLLLAHILVGGFDPFQGAPENVILENRESSQWSVYKRDKWKRKLPALEVAIISESKTFLSSSACQKVVNAIYEGRVVYTPSSWLDILPDHYKNKPISLYDPKKAPLFNQYRLIVPRTRKYLEVVQFLVLLVLYIFVMRSRDASTYCLLEFVFSVYALGWILDQFACILEHGWSVYTQNLWSFLDVTFSFLFFIYLFLRIHGVWTGDEEYSRQALDVLAIGAPVLVPRLAFNLMSENMLFLSLRSMMADFAVLTVLATWCFGGFLLAMVWLGNGVHAPITISKWMLWVWFGLDGTGIQRSVDLHWILGPILMVTFAFLGNTLFLTILVSMLSNTFAGIVSNASAEIQYRRSVLTLEGVKSDAIFAYQPPFNILALCILLPLKFVLTPRWFHKINVAAVRTLNAALLLMIGYFERHTLWTASDANPQPNVRPSMQRRPSRLGFWAFSRGFTAHGDIQAVFETDNPEESESGSVVISDDTASDRESNQELSSGLDKQQTNKTNESDPFNGHERPRLSRSQSEMTAIGSRPRSRRDSLAPFGSLRRQLRGMLTEATIDEGDDEVDSHTETRLDKLEGSMQRIERLLATLCEAQAGRGQGDDQQKVTDADVTPLEDNDANLEAERHV